MTDNGIKPLPSKVEAIQKYPLPKDVKQLCTYLGMINFYHRFVQNLAFYLAPLNEYLKKEGNKNSREFAWTEEAKAAFQKSKDLLAESALLVYPSENCKLSIVADASDVSVGGALQQEFKGTWQPIAFFSRKLDKTQQHYSAFDRELLYLLLMPQFDISGILLMDAVSPCFQITNPLYMHFILVASQSFLDEADK